MGSITGQSYPHHSQVGKRITRTSHETLKNSGGETVHISAHHSVQVEVSSISMGGTSEYYLWLFYLAICILTHCKCQGIFYMSYMMAPQFK